MDINDEDEDFYPNEITLPMSSDAFQQGNNMMMRKMNQHHQEIWKPIWINGFWGINQLCQKDDCSVLWYGRKKLTLNMRLIPWMHGPSCWLIIFDNISVRWSQNSSKHHRKKRLRMTFIGWLFSTCFIQCKCSLQCIHIEHLTPTYFTHYDNVYVNVMNSEICIRVLCINRFKIYIIMF